MRADAGDDQIGLVGRKITLNGSGSTPKGKIGYRWIQVSGPPVLSPLQDGYIFSFTPKAPGTYRFALVVAANSEISEPDLVEVLVGVLDPATAGALAQPPASLEDFIKTNLPTIPGGVEASESLARTFEALADRAELYQTYSEIYSEMSRRLEGFVPQDSARRAIWVQKLFSPLTMYLIEQLRAEGLDLARPEGHSLQLTASQKTRFARVFREMSRGYRALQPTR